jgi:hypothetical protein
MVLSGQTQALEALEVEGVESTSLAKEAPIRPSAPAEAVEAPWRLVLVISKDSYLVGTETRLWSKVKATNISNGMKTQIKTKARTKMTKTKLKRRI